MIVALASQLVFNDNRGYKIGRGWLQAQVDVKALVIFFKANAT